MAAVTRRSFWMIVKPRSSGIVDELLNASTGQGMSHKILRWLSISSGLIYLVTQLWQPYPGSFIVKGLSVGPLALLAFIAGAPMLGVALALSTLGDILLDLDPERLFVFGLGSFLVAHLVYIFVFVRYRRRPTVLGAAPRLAALF